jgi:hypothetical protein
MTGSLFSHTVTNTEDLLIKLFCCLGLASHVENPTDQSITTHKPSNNPSAYFTTGTPIGPNYNAGLNHYSHTVTSSQHILSPTPNGPHQDSLTLQPNTT